MNFKLKRDKHLKKLDHLFKLDKEAFWKKIRAMNNQKINVGTSIGKIRDENVKQFNQHIT